MLLDYSGSCVVGLLVAYRGIVFCKRVVYQVVQVHGLSGSVVPVVAAAMVAAFCSVFVVVAAMVFSLCAVFVVMAAMSVFVAVPFAVAAAVFFFFGYHIVKSLVS